MTPFEYVTAVTLLILGLGITGLLGGLIDTFRARGWRGVDWIAVTWALVVFSVQMQFLWASYELNRLIPNWSLSSFSLALLLALLLFVAGAIVLPREASAPEVDPTREFQKEGRWALVALAAYFLVAFAVNPVFFDMPWFAPLNLYVLSLALAVLPACFIQDRRNRTVATIIFVALLIPALVVLSPRSY